VGVDDITGATYSVDQLSLIRIVHFGAQTPHHDVEDIGAGLKINSPDVALDLFARYDFAGCADQLCEEEKFLGCQVKRIACADRAISVRIQL
jgi:hypothetical protein